MNTLVYSIDKTENPTTLYVNLTNACTNNCVFCLREQKDDVCGKEMWLETEQISLEQIIEQFNTFATPQQIVFCGYGEPSYRLDDAVYVAKRVKEKYPEIKIRINTNGQSDLILGEDSAPLYNDAFDTVSVSLNAPTPEKYQEICHSAYGIGALDAVITFASNVKAYVSEVIFSVVREFITEDEIEKCKKISESTGVPLRIRDYIS